MRRETGGRKGGDHGGLLADGEALDKMRMSLSRRPSDLLTANLRSAQPSAREDPGHFECECSCKLTLTGELTE